MLIIFIWCIFILVVQSQIPINFDYLSNIDPTIIQQPRYAIQKNFVGQVIDGYLQQKIVLTKNAGYALGNVQKDLKLYGYGLVVYDAYRPQKAVDHFLRWSKQPQDFKTKQQFYPYLDKSRIIPEGYVAEKSGHSRGSTVDLTIIELGSKIHDVVVFPYELTDGTKIYYRDDGTVFMGGHFDYFGELSHHDTTLIPADILQKRNFFKAIMVKNGFKPYDKQWWHYTLVSEPFPNTYFDFDIV